MTLAHEVMPSERNHQKRWVSRQKMFLFKTLSPLDLTVTQTYRSNTTYQQKTWKKRDFYSFSFEREPLFFRKLIIRGSKMMHFYSIFPKRRKETVSKKRGLLWLPRKTVNFLVEQNWFLYRDKSLGWSKGTLHH